MSRYTDVVVIEAGASPLWWEEHTWTEVQAMVRAGTEMAILPLGATEQHGPHLPLNVDSIFATAFAAYASAKTKVPVLPTLTVGCSLGHTDYWPGTLSIWPATLIAYIREISVFLRNAGIKKLLLVNSHWGNVSAARCAIDAIRYEFSEQFSIGIKSTFDITPSVWKQFTDDGLDFHANRAETALMLYLDSRLVRIDNIPMADDPDRTDEKVFTYTVPQTSTNGVTGFPSRATVADGKKLFLEIGQALVGIVERARTEVPPLASSEIQESILR